MAMPAASSSNLNHAPRLRGQPAVVPIHAGQKSAEVALKEALRTTSPIDAALYSQAEQLQSPTTSTGDLSVSAMLDLLEMTKPPPATFDSSSMLGAWRLEYTNGLPSIVQDEVAKHVEDPVIDVSVVMTVSQTGEMETTATLSLRSGVKRVTSWKNHIEQNEVSPVFSVSDQVGEQMSAEVSYISNDFLVLRNGFGNYDQMLNSNGLTRSSIITDVWSKIEQPSSEAQAATGTSLWRYGLRSDMLPPQVDYVPSSPAMSWMTS